MCSFVYSSKKYEILVLCRLAWNEFFQSLQLTNQCSSNLDFEKTYFSVFAYCKIYYLVRIWYKLKVRRFASCRVLKYFKMALNQTVHAFKMDILYYYLGTCAIFLFIYHHQQRWTVQTTQSLRNTSFLSLFIFFGLFISFVSLSPNLFCLFISKSLLSFYH